MFWVFIVFAADAPPAPPLTANNGSVVLALSSNRLSYYTVIQLGDINFRVALDTASSDLWVLTSQCTTSACHDLPRYPIQYQSPSFVIVNGNQTGFELGYADGTGVKGFVGKETVGVGGLAVQGQSFGMVQESNVSFVDLTSGVLGLGFPRLSTIASGSGNANDNTTMPFFARLAEEGRLAYPLFGLSATWNQGSLSLGAVDSSIVKNLSQIVWNDVVEFPPTDADSRFASYLHWVLPLTSLSVTGTAVVPQKTFNNGSNEASLALFDIGTSGIYGPHQDVERIFDAIQGARRVADGQWAVPCDYSGTISFSFGKEEYVLQPTDYLIGPAEGNPNLCLSLPVALAPSADGIDWQLGGPFLRKVYSVYSYGINRKESPKIGLYRLNAITSTPQTEGQVNAFFSSISATVPTTLPNQVLPSQTYITPTYLFNSSVSAPTGGIVSSNLATSTYSALLKQETGKYNASAIPTISPVPSVATIVLTNSMGAVTTETQTKVFASVTLGVPPGWTNGAKKGSDGILMVVVVCFSLSAVTLL
ncbi:acid protease [Flagelloscypha sp. PMI_526]|nr:acid protease [Flagelloscypha sp. PMI_526]